MPPVLPVDAVLPEVVSALQGCPFLVLEAPPGAGKTTRVPLTLARQTADDGEVVVTEPRRLAARLAATFVARELGEPVGGFVGYSVRHDEKRSPRTRVRYVTEGLLLTEFARDPDLRHARVVVLDEFHERHVEGDLLLALLRRLAKRRPELWVVVMSATLDAEPIARFLGGCPRITSAGRQFPLTVEYDTELEDRPLEKRVSLAVKQALRGRDDGNVLVFLPGAGEIARASEALAPALADSGVEVLPLHGELPLAAQARAVEAIPGRRVVLATNVAESSVTVHGVTTVIDSGLGRVPTFSPWTGRKSLILAEVSQSSCVQRAGRAGRTAPGRVVRLYSESNFKHRPKAMVPEIQRADLSEPLLLLAALGLPPDELEWLDAPPSAALSSAARLLGRLGAFARTEPPLLSPLGRTLARLPLPVRLGRVLVAAQELGVAESGALAAALLGAPDIRERDPRRDAESGASDVQDRIDAYRMAAESRFARHSLVALGLRGRSVDEVRRTFEAVRRGLPEDREPGDAAETALRRALLAGFPDCVARRVEAGSDALVLCNGTRARLAADSVVHHGSLLLALDAEERSVRAGTPSRGTEGPGVRVRWAAAIDAEWLLDDQAASVEPLEELVWNAELGRVDSTCRLVYGSVVLDESRGRAAPSAAASELLYEKAGMAAQQSDRLVTLRERLGTLVRCGLSSSEPTPLPELVRAACEGRVAAAELDPEELCQLWLERLDAGTRQLLAKEVPERIRLPGGRGLEVHYEPGKPPWVASRLQDFFGMTVTPSLCRGRVPLVLHLLAPNQRAVQVTTDLEGFWQRHYPGLRQQLCRRYPRHPWPEDGATATPPEPKAPRRR